jgi:putative transposase
MMYVRFPLSLRNVEHLAFERGINICHETVRLWWNRFGRLFVDDMRRQCIVKKTSLHYTDSTIDQMRPARERR